MMFHTNDRYISDYGTKITKESVDTVSHVLLLSNLSYFEFKT